MVEHKLVSFATIVDRFNFTNTSVVEKHARQKLCHFCRCVVIAKLFCQKMFGLGHPNWSVRMENFLVHPHYQDIGRNVRDFSNRGSTASLLKKSKFHRTKERRGEISGT